MKDAEKTKEQLIEELTQLRRRVGEQEDQLAESRRAEEDQRQINCCLPVLLATAGLDGFYTEVNAAFERILGWSEQESLSRPFMEFIHPDDHATAVEVFEQLKSGDTVTDFVDRNVHKDGSYRWISWVVIPLLDRGIVFGIGQDVTSRKQAELELHEAREKLEERVAERTADLQESNEKLKREIAVRRVAVDQLCVFRTFADAAGQGFGMADMDGNIIYANPALAALVGEQSPTNMLGKHVSIYYPSEYLKKRESEIFPVVSRDGYWQGELTMFALTGEQIPTLQTSFTVPDADGKAVARGVVITDLRRIKRAEETLWSSLHELQSIYDGMVDGLLIADIENRFFVKANRAIGQMLGYTPDELSSMSVMDIHPREHVPTVLENFQSLAKGHLHRADSLPVLRKDGSVFFADITCARIVFNDRPCLIGFFRDISERKQAEKAVQEEQHALDRMLRASDRDRELLTYELHDGVAQRILGALMHFDSYRQGNANVPEETKSASFNAGLMALREASAEIRSLMNRTRTPVLQKFGVAAAIADFIDQFSDQPDAPEIIYRCDVHFKRLPPVLENAIYRVTQEAITNACTHSRSEIVRVALAQEGDELTIDVQDSGIGFDTADVKKDRFGLHGIRERTRLLGKCLRIDSTPGVGTLIQAVFPLIYGKEEDDSD